MSPSQILQILWRRAWISALTLLSALAVASAVLFLVPGRYDATATASIDPSHSDPITGAGSSPASNAIIQGNLISLVESERVALTVVQRLNLASDPEWQKGFRASESFGRMQIENWIAGSLLKSVDARFSFGSNVMSITFHSNSPLRSALIANSFLAATIDAAIAMKAENGAQTARWFGPQIDALRAELAAKRAALQEYQKQSSMLAPQSAGDSENSQLMAVTQELSNARATLTSLQSRFDSPTTDQSADPSDPELQLASSLRSKLSSAQADFELMKATLGDNNPKVIALLASLKATQRQLNEATLKLHDHLKDRIETTKVQIKTLEEARAKALAAMIQVQGQRDKLTELQRDVAFKQDQLSTEEKAAVQAQLQSKLTFSDISVLDKANPPVSPAFPKPFVVLAVSIGAGLSLGLVLALLAEALDRRVRHPDDLGHATSAPVLGAVAYRRIRQVKPRLIVSRV